MASRRLSDAEILAQVPAARVRERRERKQGLRASAARYDRAAGRVVLELTNGYSFAFPVAAIPALQSASPSTLATVEIDPSGGALRWDSLDVDLSVPGLLLGAVGVDERLRTFRRPGWERQIGRQSERRARQRQQGRPAQKEGVSRSVSLSELPNALKPWAGGRPSPSRSSLLRRRTDRRHRTRAPTRPRHGGMSSRSRTSPVRGSSRLTSLSLAFPGAVPELPVDPRDARDEAIGLDGPKNRAGFGIDLMDLPRRDTGPPRATLRPTRAPSHRRRPARGW